MRHRLVDVRENFVRTEEERKAENERYVFERDKLAERFRGKLLAECKVAGIRVPPRYTVELYVKQKHSALYDSTIEPYEREALELRKRHEARVQRLNERLYTLASMATLDAREPAGILPPNDPWVMYFSASEYDYSTQTNPRMYAEASVNSRVWTVGYVDPRIQCRIVWEEKECKLYVALGSDLDRRILYTRCYHEGVPIEEFIRRCWARAWNPRVLDPFLPAGLEDKLGLDYQGRNIHAVSYECKRCGAVYPREATPAIQCKCGFDLRPTTHEPA